VRPPSAARTLDFIEVRFEDIPRARDAAFPRYSTNYGGGPAFFSDVPAVRRPIDNYTRTSYAPVLRLRRVLSCGARLALEGVTRISRRGRNRSYLRLVLFLLSVSHLRRFRRQVSTFLARSSKYIGDRDFSFFWHPLRGILGWIIRGFVSFT